MPDIKALQDVDGNITYVVEGSNADDGTLLNYTEIPALEQEIDNNGNVVIPALANDKNTFTQVAHGFVMPAYGLIPVVYDNDNSKYILAQTNEINRAADAFITEIIDVDTFILDEGGMLNRPAHGLNIGEWYVLDNVAAGTCISLKDFEGPYRQYLFFVIDANYILTRIEPVINIIALTGSAYYQATNLDVTTNLNTSTSLAFPTNVPIFGSVELGDTNFTTTNDEEIVFEFDGIVKISVNLLVTSTGQRNTIQIRLKKNGTAIGPIGGTGYIRAASGHNEASLHIATYCLTVSEGDTLNLGARLLL